MPSKITFLAVAALAILIALGAFAGEAMACGGGGCL